MIKINFCAVWAIFYTAAFSYYISLVAAHFAAFYTTPSKCCRLHFLHSGLKVFHNIFFQNNRLGIKRLGPRSGPT